MFSFEPKTKKQLIRELSKKGIPWKRNKRNIIVDGLSIEGYQNLKLKYIFNAEKYNRMINKVQTKIYIKLG